MMRMVRCGSIALTLLVAGACAPVEAGPYFGEWSWCWRPGPECSRGDYSRLHYWAPELYRVRACLCPSNVDQYPPGPYPPVAPGFLDLPSRCQYTAPTPSPAYAEPGAYYGTSAAGGKGP
jgi:hypothetical protein